MIKQEEKANISVSNQDVASLNEQNSSVSSISNENSEELQKGSKEYNWRKMEEKLQQSEKEQSELKRRYLELEEKLKTSFNKKEEIPEQPQLDADDIITYEQYKKLNKEDARVIVQEELKNFEKSKQPIEVRSKYSDYDQIVTLENIEKLKKEDPELEKLIMASNNPYERVYKEIKRSNFFKDSLISKESEEKIAKNSQKPTSSTTFGKQRPLSYANDFAKGDVALWKEIVKYRGGSL